MQHPFQRGLKVPFAETEDGTLIDMKAYRASPHEHLFCPHCRSLVAARMGHVRVHHFAHVSRKDCAGALETALHKAAKAALADAARDGLAFHAPGNKGLKPWGPYPALSGHISEVRIECSIKHKDELRRPDALLTWDHGHLAVEFCVTHPVDDGKQYFYEVAGLDCIEIMLGEAHQKSNQAEYSLESLREIVLTQIQHKEWISDRRLMMEALRANGNPVEITELFGKYQILP